MELAIRDAILPGDEGERPPELGDKVLEVMEATSRLFEFTDDVETVNRRGQPGVV